MEIDDTFKNKSSATFGKRNHTFKREKKRKFQCAKTELLFIVLFTILCPKLASLLLSLLVPFIRHAGEKLWKFCATQGVSWVATITKSLPRLRAKLARFSVVSAFKYYCNVIVSLRKGGAWKQREPNAKEHLKGGVHLASVEFGSIGQGLTLIGTSQFNSNSIT